MPTHNPRRSLSSESGFLVALLVVYVVLSRGEPQSPILQDRHPHRGSSVELQHSLYALSNSGVQGTCCNCFYPDLR
ncbi:hypothetical protein FB451DRAFT_1262015 [Mycena latifolia]|nr:hypothetical protein FB451DRAFT_1262015 [Mycena latifolia]